MGQQAYDFWFGFITSRLNTLSKNHQQISGEKNMENIVKGSQNEAEKVAKTTQMEPKWCQSEPRDVPQSPLGNMVENLKKHCIKLGHLFDQKPINIQSNESSTT